MSYQIGQTFKIARPVDPAHPEIDGYGDPYFNGTVVRVSERRRKLPVSGPSGHVWVKADDAAAGIWVEGKDLAPVIEPAKGKPVGDAK